MSVCTKAVVATLVSSSSALGVVAVAAPNAPPANIATPVPLSSSNAPLNPAEFVNVLCFPSICICIALVTPFPKANSTRLGYVATPKETIFFDASVARISEAINPVRSNPG